jgi:hypothetical protein
MSENGNTAVIGPTGKNLNIAGFLFWLLAAISRQGSEWDLD